MVLWQFPLFSLTWTSGAANRQSLFAAPLETYWYPISFLSVCWWAFAMRNPCINSL